MSAVQPPPTAPGALLCPRCSSTLHADQSWCLECGLATRTRIHPPPSWRLPVLLTCVVLALAAAAIAVGLVALVGNPSSTPAPATTVTAPATTPTATTPLQTAPATTPTAPATVPTTPVPRAKRRTPGARTTPKTSTAPAAGAIK
ncbi:MAG TPA: hypothetical protein VN635_09945 [Conexibacter sp.]|nr:hypothetical protein [Conexibacter sp.]